MKKWNTSIQAMDPLFEKIEALSKLQRILICAATFLLLIGAFVYFSYMPKIERIQSLTKERDAIGKKLAVAQEKARQLASYREQKKRAEADFRIARKVLPEEKEIPSLLTGISRSGQEAGLEFLMSQPHRENIKDFYAEIPVGIQVTGGYHNVAEFFDNVARLYRIVNIRDIEMKTGGRNNTLSTSCTAVTYRFVEPEKQPAKGKEKGKRRRR
jgi:type IV pilus assembly protein PilO